MTAPDVRDVRAAAELIHDALDAADASYHERERGIIDLTSGELARALLAAGWVAPGSIAFRPRDADHAQDWLYERAEDASVAGLPLDAALQAVRDGYSSIDADRMIAEDP